YLLMTGRLIAVDVTSMNGTTSQSMLGQKTFVNKASALFVQGNYAFVGYESNDDNLSISVFDLSSLANITEIEQFNLGNNVGSIKQIYVTNNTNELYELTEYNAGDDQLF